MVKRDKIHCTICMNCKNRIVETVETETAMHMTVLSSVPSCIEFQIQQQQQPNGKHTAQERR